MCDEALVMYEYSFIFYTQHTHTLTLTIAHKQARALDLILYELFCKRF